MRKKLSADEIDAIAELRERRGLSCKAIARRIGRPHGTVIGTCLRFGIDAPNPRPLLPATHIKRPVFVRSGRPVRAFTPEEDAMLIAAAREGKDAREIGLALGRSPSSIRCRLMTLARREEREAADADRPRTR